MTNRNLNWQGMNWIRQEKRLAIYLRDGLACVWCGASVEQDAVQLSLDHLVPHCQGGSNDHRNLVTACKRCNDSRGARALRAFAKAVAAYLGRSRPQDVVEVLRRVRSAAARALPLDEAKQLIQRRGSVARVLSTQR